MQCHSRLDLSRFSALCRCLLAVAVGLSLASCTSDDPGKKKKTEDPAELEATVASLLEEVKGAGADAEEIEAIEALIQKAAASTEKGKPELAVKSLKSAQKSLIKLQEDSEKTAESLKKLAADKTAAVDAKKRADGAKAAQLAPEAFKHAQDTLAKANAAAAKKSSTGAAQAKQLYQQAKEAYDDAIAQAKANESDKKRADEEKKEMLAKKEEAKTKGAEQKAAVEWNYAAQVEREAESLLAKGDFSQATDSFKSAQNSYVDAIAAVIRVDEDAAREAEAKKAEAEAIAAGKTPNDPKETGPEVEEPRPTAKPAVKPVAIAPSPTGIAPPQGFDPNAEAFKQDIDAEDEELLNSNYSKLTPSGKLEYDMTTGMVTINYAEGTDVKKDAIYDPSLPTKGFLQFRPVMQTPQRGGPGFGPEQKKQLAAYSFAANTQGQLFFPIPLRFYARVEYLMQINTMDQANNFGMFLMYNKAKGGYMTDWVKAGTTKGTGGRVPPQFTKSANEWFDKVNMKPMVLEYLMTDAKTGMLTNIYNNDDAANEGQDKLTVKVPSAAYQRGIVGFKWSRVKFQVVDLVITGVLDKQEAVKILREKLKMPKAAPKKEETKKEGGKEEEPKPDNPAAPKDEAAKEGGEQASGEAEAPKKAADASKPKKPFDF